MNPRNPCRSRPRAVAGGLQTGRGMGTSSNGVDNIWIQPLDGSPGRPLTEFKSEQVPSIDWCPDGKNLGILPGHTDSDVILLQESKIVEWRSLPLSTRAFRR